MNLRDNKGITGIDISVALIIIVLFVGIISTLSYNYVIASRSMNRKAIATNIAISKIESIKSQPYDQVIETNGNLSEMTEYRDINGVQAPNGPYEVVTEVQKYINSNYINNTQDRTQLQDVIKIVKVTVNYNTGNRKESIELKTTITKED